MYHVTENQMEMSEFLRSVHYSFKMVGKLSVMRLMRLVMFKEEEFTCWKELVVDKDLKNRDKRITVKV